MNYYGPDHKQQRTGIAFQLLGPALLGLIWISMIMLANPIGDFPLNDDRAYGYSVQRLLQQGQLRFSDWTATNLLGQVLWGALFCLPLGFSFTALRLSTASLGLVGILATYGILRELKTPRLTAAVGALTLAFCPIYFARTHILQHPQSLIPTELSNENAPRRVSVAVSVFARSKTARSGLDATQFAFRSCVNG